MKDSRNDKFVIAKKGNVSHFAYVHLVNLPSEKVATDTVPNCGKNYKDEKTFVKPRAASGFSSLVSSLRHFCYKDFVKNNKRQVFF